MWQLIAAECRYAGRSMAGIALLIIPGLLLYLQASPRSGASVALLPLSAGVLIQMLVLRSLEKRDRQLALLPVGLRTLAWARVLLLLLPVLGLYGLYFGLQLFLHPASARWHHDPGELMLIFGLTLSGFAIYLILHDLSASRSSAGKSPGRDVAFLILVVIIIIFAVPLLLVRGGEIAPLQWTQRLCFLCSLLLLYPAVLAFMRRRSYLH